MKEDNKSLCEYDQGHLDGIDVLDKIRAEIEQGYCEVEDDYDRGRNMGLYIAMQIIDHYKAESEDKGLINGLLNLN